MTGDSEVIRAALQRACAHLTLDAVGATLVHSGENTIFALPSRVIARVSRPGQVAAARREVAVAQWMLEAAIPAVRPLEDLDHPVVVGDRAVTFWHELPPHRHGQPAEIAQALQRLHNAKPPEEPRLGEIDPFVRLPERIQAAITLTPDDRAWLDTRLDELTRRWAKRPAGDPLCVVHGDAWSGNVVATDSHVLFLDLERTALGPPEWDLVHTALQRHSLGKIPASDYTTFCETYGRDVTEWAGYPLLRDIRELRMTTMAAQVAANHPDIEQQANHRIECLQGKHGPRPWSGWSPVT
ncbi:phosphotransferase family protein [Actinokineospora cianjurensis]|uniref:Phosphotransferase family enzyme n=1 Tax=Actinokineospora cianjurensis TaxID=585224 RepID=A0A421B273_9PSEU|nr:phosphotransferase [Actinokineospora cianjurensis]RLK58536.1 phosphotransferase family enzyme [Actinokineospora cianjurensis]